MTFFALLAAPALAIDLRWWGVGPSVGTMAVPVNYPSGLPANAEDDDGTDLVHLTKGDVAFALRAVAYPTAAGRLGVRGTLAFGTEGWNRQELVLGYDAALIRESDFQLLLGLGIGAGTERFNEIENGDGWLRVNYFPIRGELAGLLRDRTRAYELGIYGTYHIAGENLFFAEPDADPVTGAEAAADFLGEGLAGGLYVSVGAEVTVFFGDFRSKGGGGSDGGKKGKKGRN